jgi:hypothetical protein
MVLNIPAARSLKDKRRVVKSLVTRIHNRFNASIAEVGDNDKWQIVKLGAAVVSNRSDHVNSQISAIVKMVEREPETIVVDYNIEID